MSDPCIFCRRERTDGRCTNPECECSIPLTPFGNLPKGQVDEIAEREAEDLAQQKWLDNHHKRGFML